MSLKKQIEEKLNKALKEKNKNIYPTLRLIVSAIKDAEIANRTKIALESIFLRYFSEFIFLIKGFKYNS